MGDEERVWRGGEEVSSGLVGTWNNTQKRIGFGRAWWLGLRGLGRARKANRIGKGWNRMREEGEVGEREPVGRDEWEGEKRASWRAVECTKGGVGWGEGFSEAAEGGEKHIPAWE
eukprot:6193055-Pleurochrysis_carterae.AAC.2